MLRIHFSYVRLLLKADVLDFLSQLFLVILTLLYPNSFKVFYCIRRAGCVAEKAVDTFHNNGVLYTFEYGSM